MTAIKDTPVFNRIADFFAQEPTKPTENSERNPKGTFRNGNRGGPGNPYARRVAKLRQAVMEECAEEDLRDITRAMIDLAKGGDKAAAKLIYQYALGKPDKQVDPDRIDEHELGVLKGVAVPAPLLEALLAATPADTVNRLVQEMWPALMKTMAKQLDEQIVANQEFDRQMDEEIAAFEALPAEERLRQYHIAKCTPSPELVEEAEKERAAREAKENVATPTANGVSQQEKTVESAAKESASTAARRSPNGFCLCPTCGGLALEPQSSPGAAPSDRS